MKKMINLTAEVGGGQAFSKSFNVVTKSPKHIDKVNVTRYYSDSLIDAYHITLTVDADIYVCTQEYTESYDYDLAEYKIVHYQNGIGTVLLHFCSYLATDDDIEEYREAKYEYQQFVKSFITIA